MNTRIITVFLLFVSAIISAQSESLANYTWDANPKYSVSAEDSKEDMIALKDKVIVEFFFDNNNFSERFVEHRVLWLNSDDRIEEFNKIYLPYTGSTQLEVSKARVIKKNGEIIELDKSKILSAEDEETGRKYTYFALEGIEKGSFIEYFYIQKKSPSYTGRRLYFQSSHKKKNISFELYSPSNLVFDFKSYNNLPDVKQDTTSVGRFHWKMTGTDIPALDKESQAPYNASRGFIVYKLDRNLANNMKITSYMNVAGNLYAFYYPKFNEKTKASIQSFISQINLTDDLDEASKIRKIDSYIKSTIYNAESRGSEQLNDLSYVVESKTANETGLIKLYAAIFKTLNIQHEMVLTADRGDLKFDQTYEANNFLQDFLFYFPKVKKYLSPNEFDTRFGYPPTNLTDNYGLFIQEEKVGDLLSPVSKVKYINAVKAEESKDDMILDVSFDPDDFTITNIHLKRSMSGYYAMFVHPFTNLIPPDKKNEFLDAYAKQIDKDSEVSKREMENENPELFGVKPLVLKFDIESESFVEKAGNKYLFKLGDLIGPQLEMYQEKKRVLPLESDFQRSYYRTINVKIPEGYRISNLDDINIKNVFNDGGKELFSFHSYYSVENNVLKVTADEHYRENIIQPELYEEYRKVINSAADFNKITLILEPK